MKPCPFKSCNSVAGVFVGEVPSVGGVIHQVMCSKCGSRGPEALTESAAIEEWNKRATSAGKEETMTPERLLPRCPVCLDEATYQTPDGKYWCGRAHSWNHVECAECKGMRVRTYPDTPIGSVDTCRGCKGTATADVTR